jgi:hypothetical protein
MTAGQGRIKRAYPRHYLDYYMAHPYPFRRGLPRWRARLGNWLVRAAIRVWGHPG